MILEVLLTLSLNAYAEDPSSLIFSGEVSQRSPYVLKFTPPKGHHFNLEAPARVELAQGSASEMGVLNKGLQKITADFKSTKLEKDCQVKASLYVCNDANTYCRPVKQDFDCEKLAVKK